MERRIVVRGGAVVLHDLPAALDLEDDRLAREVHGALVAERGDTRRERLLDDGERVLTRQVAAERDPARAGRREQILEDVVQRHASGWGTATTWRSAIPSKSCGLTVWSGRPFAMATEAISAS